MKNDVAEKETGARKVAMADEGILQVAARQAGNLSRNKDRRVASVAHTTRRRALLRLDRLV